MILSLYLNYSLSFVYLWNSYGVICRLRTIDAENAQLLEANESLINQKRQLEAEKDELEDARGRGGGMNVDERRRLEAKVAALEEEVEEEQSLAELALDKQRKAQMQVKKTGILLSFLRFRLFIW